MLFSIRMFSLTLLVAVLSFYVPPALATDSYQVKGVESWDVLYIRSSPSTKGRKIGSIPSSGRGIKRLGACQGTWCKISYRGTVGWSSMKYLASEPSTRSVDREITLLGETWAPQHALKPEAAQQDNTPHGKLILEEEEANVNVNEINLLGVKVIGGANANQPQDMTISGNAAKAGLFKPDKQFCPDKAPIGPKYYGSGSWKYFVVKQGADKWEKTGTKCEYKNGLLVSQYPYIKGKRHGLHLSYAVTKDGKRYLNNIAHFAYDELHGVFAENKEYPYQDNRLGKRYSYTYVNGQRHGPYQE